MRADRTRIKALLAAGLDDAAAIEARPIEEVRAELFCMGVDPTASIRLAQSGAHSQSMADGQSRADSPANTLLEKIARSEAVDAEIAALEAADIDEVRASLPAGMTASATAAAERHSGRPSKVVGLKKRRGSVLGWGGSLVGIAACVLLFIAIRPDRLDEARAPLSPIEGRSSNRVAADLADAGMEDGGTKAEERVEAPATLAPAPVIRQDQLAASSESALLPATGSDDAEAAVAYAEEDGLTSLADRLGEGRERVLSMERPLDQARAAAPSAAPNVSAVPNAPVDLSWLPETVTAVVLADEARATIEIEALAEALPDQRLAARLGEARQFASTRTVVALIAFMRDGERVEAALVEAAAAPAVAGASAFAENEAVSPALKPAFELLELPSVR